MTTKEAIQKISIIFNTIETISEKEIGTTAENFFGNCLCAIYDNSYGFAVMGGCEKSVPNHLEYKIHVDFSKRYEFDVKFIKRKLYRLLTFEEMKLKANDVVIDYGEEFARFNRCQIAACFECPFGQIGFLENDKFTTINGEESTYHYDKEMFEEI